MEVRIQERLGLRKESLTDSALQKMRDQITVVIATLNEADCIGSLVDDVRSKGYDRILVVDGYSKDATRQVAEQRGAKVIGQHGKGKAGAILVARDVVDTPYFLLMDGDNTYDPADIDRFARHFPQRVSQQPWHP